MTCCCSWPRQIFVTTSLGCAERNIMNEPRADYSRSNASSHTPPMQELQYHEVHPVAPAMQTHAPVSASTACAVRKQLLPTIVPTSVVALCMCVLTWSFTKSDALNVCLSHGENRCVEGRERVRQKKELSPADGLPICHDRFFERRDTNISSANPPERFTVPPALCRTGTRERDTGHWEVDSSSPLGAAAAHCTRPLQ